MRKSTAPEQIAGAILVLRGHRVLRDAALAARGGDQFFKSRNLRP